MTERTILDEIKGQGLKLSWVAAELQIDPSLLRKKLRGERRPITEAQARHLKAILRIPLERIPYSPDPGKAA